MTNVFCEKYSCHMAPEACASRHLNAQAIATAPIGNQKYGAQDLNCRACKCGKANLKIIGRIGVDEYRKMLTRIKTTARCRAMARARHGYSITLS